ncbi:MAG: primosomal protein N', partial [Gemmatimonadota bacterium]
MGTARHEVEVALPLPVHTTFTYTVEDAAPPPGTRVLVPFRREERVGWVMGPGSGKELARIRPVLNVLEDEPSVSGGLLDLATWMARYYLAPIGVVLRTFLPSLLSDSSRDFLTLAGQWEGKGTPRERKLLEVLARAGEPRRVATLRKALKMGSLWPEIRRLSGKGIIRHETVSPTEPAVRTQRVVRISNWISDLGARDEVFGRAHRQREAYELLESSGGKVEHSHLLDHGGFSPSVIKGLAEKGLVVFEDREVFRDPFREDLPPERKDLTPTPGQTGVLSALLRGLAEPDPRPFLLHGVTGSGKTLVYIELIKEAMKNRGLGAIVLVPEIALTPQTVGRFRAHFGDQVAVLHSALSDGERYDAWRQLRRGDKRIAVGARSAVFAPVERLGVLVVDEEHDSSYKQSESPRYHARDVAAVRAGQTGALCLLGSATPSLESWHNAQTEKYRLLSLPDRVGGGTLPPVEVVDLRELWRGQAQGTRKSRPQTGDGVLSPRLVEAIRARLRRKEQVILLLNRRGYSSFVQCRECGDVWRCNRCSVSLTYHRVTGRLLCHHCRYEEEAPSRCGR